MEIKSGVSDDNLSRLAALYPFADINDLPFSWSSKDKANFISLSENNLKVHYKGNGKAHKDAASVRTLVPIPPSCMLYYFEIKILSKGRDGYMGIGLAAQGVNMQRLPGWDKQSFGYHGDDGHSFCSSGTGQPYGPIFTTNDVIGCAYNIVENNCYFTKNGHNLGIAFSDLPNVPLYPTIGLQTPGEEVEANFGLEPFVYDIEQDIKSLRHRITTSIVHYPVKYAECQTVINKLVQSWLIHNGYCSTAEVFSSATKQEFKENVQHIKQRLRIQQLVLSGKIGEAIQLTNRLYPDVLNGNPNLLFALKCRQFVEMISGTCNDKSVTNMSSSASSANSSNAACSSASSSSNITTNGVNLGDCNGNSTNDKIDIDEGEENNETNSENNHVNDDNNRLPRVLAFGKELHLFSQQLKKQNGSNEKNKKMLEDAFSLLAYSDPSKSPIAWQLNPSERENVCQQLNNAIVINEIGGCCYRPPLEKIVKHTKSSVRLNGQCGAWLIDHL